MVQNRVTVSVLLLPLAAGLLTFFATAPMARAQGAPGSLADRKSFVEEQARRSADFLTLPQPGRKADLWEYGGWWRSSIYAFDDTEETATGFRPKDRTLRDQDVRLYANFNLKNVHQFYLRTRLSYQDYNTGDNYATTPEEDYTSPQIDQCFYKLNIASFLADNPLYAMNLPFDAEGRVGRIFSTLGSGIVYNRAQNGAAIEADLENWSFEGLLTTTINWQADVDQSWPGAHRSFRGFVGGQIAYNGISRHQPYVLALVQKDYNEENPEEIGVSYHYDSQYWALGSSGGLWNTNYQFEAVVQTGYSFADPNLTPVGEENTREPILAYGGTLSLERYWVDNAMKPRFGFAYSFGTGDSDRASVTNTKSGNAAGTTDHNFLVFGYADTGYSLAPRLSNIHVYKFHVFAHPFQAGVFREMEAGVAALFFYKDKRKGAISDFRAAKDKLHIGEEVDLSLSWKIVSDLSLAVQYGAFHHGSAYYSREWRHFFGTNLTYAF